MAVLKKKTIIDYRRKNSRSSRIKDNKNKEYEEQGHSQRLAEIHDEKIALRKRRIRIAKPKTCVRFACG